jgi:hypothetical protein
MRRQPIRLALLACVLALTAAALEAPRDSVAGERRIQASSKPLDYLLGDIARYRRETWRWQRLMGVRKTRAQAVRRYRSPHYRRWVRNLWRKRAVTHRRQAHRPPHRAAWLCIHRYEGHWKDPNPPYFGGLQMDLAFQRMYGRDLLRRKGTADNWTPLEQMWVAERALRAGRGFYPWPNTARYCGLI